MKYDCPGNAVMDNQLLHQGDRETALVGRLTIVCSRRRGALLLNQIVGQTELGKNHESGDLD